MVRGYWPPLTENFLLWLGYDYQLILRSTIHNVLHEQWFSPSALFSTSGRNKHLSKWL